MHTILYMISTACGSSHKVKYNIHVSGPEYASIKAVSILHGFQRDVSRLLHFNYAYKRCCYMIGNHQEQKRDMISYCHTIQYTATRRSYPFYTTFHANNYVYISVHTKVCVLLSPGGSMFPVGPHLWWWQCSDQSECYHCAQPPRRARTRDDPLPIHLLPRSRESCLA